MNMSYCRFTNTLDDLLDCYNNIHDTDQLSEEEKKKRKRLIKLCKEIAAEFEEEEE